MGIALVANGARAFPATPDATAIHLVWCNTARQEPRATTILASESNA